MAIRTGRWASLVGAAAMALSIPPVAAPAQAQGWDNGASCWNRNGRDRERCEREQERRRDNDERRDRERDRNRERRNDAKTDGVVAGVVGTVLLGGVIAAIATSGKRDRNNDRRDPCADRADSYRASDGRWYPCR